MDKSVTTVFRRVHRNGKFIYTECQTDQVEKLTEISERYQKTFPLGIYRTSFGDSTLFITPNDYKSYTPDHWHFTCNSTNCTSTTYYQDDGGWYIHNGLYLGKKDKRCFDPKYIYDRKPITVDVLKEVSSLVSPDDGESGSEFQASKEFVNLFMNLETFYRTPGAKQIYVISLKQNDNYINYVGFLPRKKRKKTIHSSCCGTTWRVFETKDTDIETIKQSLIDTVMLRID